MNILYSTGCPKCRVLEKKLKEAGIDYKLETNINILIDKGFKQAPILKVGDDFLDFGQAIQYARKGDRVEDFHCATCGL